VSSDASLRWSNLEPDPGMTAALDHAGGRPAPGASHNDKRNWSGRFAHRCAVSFAECFRRADLPRKTIRPLSLADGTEPLTPLGSGTRKRIDVTIVDEILGLEIGVSLKGLNFRDEGNGNFDKNLTGRLYELGDEMRLVHEHLPHAFMAAVLLLPIEATLDKSEGAKSSFAHAVEKLNERTGRLDPALAAHSARCDAGFVGLYADGTSSPFHRGVVRFFDVRSVGSFRPDAPGPPRRGRPLVSETLSIQSVADTIVRRARYEETVVWGAAERDD
jgi:hypothetical protein